MKVKGWVLAGIGFGPLWAFVNGAHFTTESLFSNLLIGTTVGLAVTYAFRRFYGSEIDIGRALRAVPAAVGYLAVFAREVVVANVDVAYRVLALRMPIEPQVIYVPLRVETPLGVTTIANSITVTPGTVTLDHDPDENALFVHLITGRDPQAVVEPIRQWEDYALVIFDEERSPEDPPPEMRVHPPDRPPTPKSTRALFPIEREALSRGAETVPADGEPDETGAKESDTRDTGTDSADGGGDDGR
jgi:multicomponent Na+:H+ antiporter subunit E